MSDPFQPLDVLLKTCKHYNDAMEVTKRSHEAVVNWIRKRLTIGETFVNDRLHEAGDPSPSYRIDDNYCKNGSRTPTVFVPYTLPDGKQAMWKTTAYQLLTGFKINGVGTYPGVLNQVHGGIVKSADCSQWKYFQQYAVLFHYVEDGKTHADTVRRVLYDPMHGARRKWRSDLARLIKTGTDEIVGAYLAKLVSETPLQGAPSAEIPVVNLDIQIQEMEWHSALLTGAVDALSKPYMCMFDEHHRKLYKSRVFERRTEWAVRLPMDPDICRVPSDPQDALVLARERSAYNRSLTESITEWWFTRCRTVLEPEHAVAGYLAGAADNTYAWKVRDDMSDEDWDHVAAKDAMHILEKNDALKSFAFKYRQEWWVSSSTNVRRVAHSWSDEIQLQKERRTYSTALFNSLQIWWSTYWMCVENRVINGTAETDHELEMAKASLTKFSDEYLVAFDEPCRKMYESRIFERRLFWFYGAQLQDWWFSKYDTILEPEHAALGYRAGINKTKNPFMWYVRKGMTEKEWDYEAAKMATCITARDEVGEVRRRTLENFLFENREEWWVPSQIPLYSLPTDKYEEVRLVKSCADYSKTLHNSLTNWWKINRDAKMLTIFPAAKGKRKNGRVPTGAKKARRGLVQ